MKRIVPLLACLFVVVGCSKESGSKPKTRPATTKVTVSNLLDLYQKQGEEAEKSFKSKYLRLDGHLAPGKFVKLEDGRQAVVLFKEYMLEPGEDGYVFCIIPEAEMDNFNLLSKGDKATIAGKCAGKQDPVAGSPFTGPAIVLEDCWVDMKPFTCPKCKEQSFVVESATEIICPHCKEKLKRSK
ncbi:MAG: hypothetical protein AB7K24_05510 [Gemmataceae bacterium]